MTVGMTISRPKCRDDQLGAFRCAPKRKHAYDHAERWKVPKARSAFWDNAVAGWYAAGDTPNTSITWPIDRFAAYLNGISYDEAPPLTDDDYWDAYPETLTTADVAKILHVGKPAVFARLQSGIIPAHQVVGSWIIFKAEIRAWLDSTSNQDPPSEPAEVDVLATYGDELSYRDLMNLFNKTKPTIYRWLQTGEIPAYHVGIRWIIHKTQLRQRLRETSNQRGHDE